MSGGSAREIFITLVAVLGASAWAIVSHEVGHGYVALLNGDTTARDAGRLTFNITKHFNLTGLLMMLFVGIGWANPVPVNPYNFRKPKLGMITVSLAGVTVNLLNALVCFACIGLVLLIPESAIESNVFVEVIFLLLLYFFEYSVLMNVGLIAFNILPLYPLDGYRVVETLAPNSKYCVFMRRVGVYFLFGFILLSYVLGLIYSPLDIFGNYISWVWSMVQKLIILAWT